MATRILVVEDEPELNGAIVAGLCARGHQAWGARSVAEARGSLENEPFDAAVVDVQLPDGLGIDLLEDTRRRRPAIPVIVMTGFAAESELDRARNAGAVAVMHKPVDVSKLVRHLQNGVA